MYTDHAAVTELFKGKNLKEIFPRWYLTIQESSLKLKYIQGCSNVVANGLSRNALLRSMSDTPPATNFSLRDLGNAQRKHDIWSEAIYALESGDETTLLRHPIPFSQFF